MDKASDVRVPEGISDFFSTIDVSLFYVVIVTAKIAESKMGEWRFAFDERDYKVVKGLPILESPV